MTQIYVITGTSTGIGLELVKQLSSKEGNIVYAGARNPEGSKELMALVDNKNVIPFTIDVDSRESIEKAAAKVSETANEGIDVLINNAGVGTGFDQTSLTTSREEYLRVFNTNVGSVSDVTQVFLPLLRKRGIDKVKKIINMSSIMSSLSTSLKSDTTGAMTPYKVSKAALNVLTELLANALASESFIVVSLHPGWVRTRMGGEYGELDAPESVRGQLNVLSKLTTADNGHFVSFDGQTIPW